MQRRKDEHATGKTRNWKEEFVHWASELEDWIERMALRLGDAIFGERTSDELFGPHRHEH